MQDYLIPLPLDTYLALECTFMPKHETHLRCIVSRNGVRMVSAKCRVCKAVTGYLKHQDVEKHFGISVDAIPIDYTNACCFCDGKGCTECSSQCERCRRYIKTEGHHIAPRAMFEDCNYWPVVSLCRLCHQEWHRVMTPGMRYNPAPVAAHLRAEWDAYRKALDWVRNCKHDYFCECKKCVDARQIRDAWSDRYRKSL